MRRFWLSLLVVSASCGEEEVEPSTSPSAASEVSEESPSEEPVVAPPTQPNAVPPVDEASQDELDALAEAQELADLLEAADTEESASPNAAGELVPAVMVQREGLHLTALVLAPEIDGRSPVGARSTYAKSADDAVNCFFRVENPERVDTSVSLAWEDAEGQSRNEPRVIPVPPTPRFIHWRYTSTSWRRPGAYRCVIRDADGEELGHAPFELVE